MKLPEESPLYSHHIIALITGAISGFIIGSLMGLLSFWIIHQ